MDTNEAVAKVRAAWSADPEVFVTTSDEARRFVVALTALGMFNLVADREPFEPAKGETVAWSPGEDNARVREAMASHAKARDDEYGT